MDMSKEKKMVSTFVDSSLILSEGDPLGYLFSIRDAEGERAAALTALVWKDQEYPSGIALKDDAHEAGILYLEDLKERKVFRWCSACDEPIFPREEHDAFECAERAAADFDEEFTDAAGNALLLPDDE